jgi:hypothetical protein
MNFGRTVAISEAKYLNLVLLCVGAENDDTYGVGAGSVFFYSKSIDSNNDIASNWDLDEFEVPDDLTPYSYFGHSVALDGTTAAVGAISQSSKFDSPTGSVYIFARQSTTSTSFSPQNNSQVVNYITKWVQVAKLTPEDGNSFDYFGYTISMYNKALIIGSPYYSDNSGYSVGAVYCFHQIEENIMKWSLKSKVVEPNPILGSRFGLYASIHDSWLAIGSSGKYSKLSSAYIIPVSSIINESANSSQGKLKLSIVCIVILIAIPLILSIYFCSSKVQLFQWLFGCFQYSFLASKNAFESCISRFICSKSKTFHSESQVISSIHENVPCVGVKPTSTDEDYDLVDKNDKDAIISRASI